MTQQIINTGTGPDSYTGDTIRVAFTKVNSNFSELYASSGTGSGNITGNVVTANTVTVSGNITASYLFGNGSQLTGITASSNYGNSNVASYLPTYSGNVNAAYFFGNGSQLTGISASLGNITVGGTTGQTLIGGVAGSLIAQPYAGNLFVVRTDYANSGISTNLTVGTNSTNQIFIKPAGITTNLIIGSNSATITFGANNNIIGYGTPPNPGYTHTFNGSLYAREFYADANFPTGYQFTTPLGLTGMSHAYQNDVNGNVSLVKINHDNATPAKFYENNTSLLSGNLVVLSGNTAGSFPDAFIQAFSSANTYTQFIWQNLNSGEAATGDIVVTSDTGTDTANYIDLGITGSNYDNTNPTNSLGTSVNYNNGYLYVKGNNDGSSGNLTIGTVDSGTVTKIIAGGVDAANVVATFSENGLTLLNSPGNVYFGTEDSQPVIVPYGTGLSLTANRANVDASYINIDQNNFEVATPGYISINNSQATNLNTDININSGDDINLRGRDKPNDSESEGGDINLYAGHGADAVTPGFDTGGGGDIQIYGGQGGQDTGGGFGGSSGGFVSIRGGDGGTSADSNAGGGGDINFTAGSAAGVANTALGGLGGGINLIAGTTTRINESGGAISLNTGSASGDGTGLAGYVEINIPSSNVNIGGIGGTWTFSGTGTTLNVPANSEIYGANFGNFTMGSAGNTIVTSSEYGSGNVKNWVFGSTGNLTVPGEIHATGNLIVQTTSGVPSFVTEITYSSGSWESNPQANLATTGGSGTGLTVDVAETGGYANTIAIHTAGTGYTNGDIITVTSGSSTATFTISVPIYDWNFGKNSVLTVPGEGIIQSIDDTVILQSKNTSTGNVYSARLGTTGGLYLETTQYPQGWLYITNNSGNAAIDSPSGNITITPALGVANGAGKGLYLRGGDADQTDFYTGTGGSVNITGGLGSFNDGGGGGPGGDINLTAGISSDPAGHAGNINITAGSGTLVFDYSGNLTVSGSILTDNIRTTEDTVHIGQNAGLSGQGSGSVAIGLSAGQLNQGLAAVAIGSEAAINGAQDGSVTVGYAAGYNNAGYGAVAIGYEAAKNLNASWHQGNGAIAIGYQAGYALQSESAIAIGSGAGFGTQGNNSIAIGAGAGTIGASTSQGIANNSIILNASGSNFTGLTANAFYVNPVRAVDGGNVHLSYNTSTKEITYSANTFVSNTYVPSTTGSAGTKGQISFDSSYVYICIGTNSWKRANLSTW